MNRTDSTTKNFQAQILNSAEIKKPCSVQSVSILIRPILTFFSLSLIVSYLIRIGLDVFCVSMHVGPTWDLLSFLDIPKVSKKLPKYTSKNTPQVFPLPTSFFYFFCNSNCTYVRPLNIILQVPENPFFSSIYFLLDFVSVD